MKNNEKWDDNDIMFFALISMSLQCIKVIWEKVLSLFWND